MAKIGRNAPCPCGSGKKYKKCCLPDEKEIAAGKAKAKQRYLEELQASRPKGPPMPGDFFIEDDERFMEDSNRIIDLIDDGDLEGAEEACKLLESRYPEMIDVPDRWALLCEARGQFEQAIAYSERCIQIITEHPDDYDPGYEGMYETAITRLRSKLARDSSDDLPENDS